VNGSASDFIPFLDLHSPHSQLADQLVNAFRRTLKSAQFVGGPEVEAFEREFAEFCNAPFCAGVNSGTDALRFAYIALGVQPGDEVLTVAHTFIATTEAITQAGGKPKFVDVREDTMTMDPAAVEDALTSRTVGIVPVHLYGQAADLDPITRAAERRRLWVVEDAAQAHGATYKGRRVGSIGSLGCFSFYPGKNLGSLGEGGAVTGSDTARITKVRQLREHGQSTKYVHETEGYNGRLHALQAAFLRVKLPHLMAWNEGRRRVAAWYRGALAGIPEVTIPVEAPDRTHVYHLYVIRASRRDALRDHLAQLGIGTGLHYPSPLHLQRAYASLGLSRGALPVTERIAESCVSLPMFPEMTEGQVARVADGVLSFYRGS